MTSYLSVGDVLCFHPENALSPISRAAMSSSCRSQEEVLFRDVYYSKPRRRNSARSLSSFTTEWSTSTDPTSNTTRVHEEKRQNKRRFMLFTNALMKFLERKDPAVFEDAKNVIRECEQKKKRGDVGFESITESLRSPLKQVVGGSYWNQARCYLRNNDHKEEEELLEPLSATEEPPSFTQSDLIFLEKTLLVADRPAYSPLATKSCLSVEEENKLRRKRFWVLIRVLMKYLEHKDIELYLKAKTAIKDCVRRNHKREEGYRNLTKCIQTSVKAVVGVGPWRRAEAYLSKIIIKKADEEQEEADYNNMIYHLNYEHSPPLDMDIPSANTTKKVVQQNQGSCQKFEHHRRSNSNPEFSDNKNKRTSRPKRTLSLAKVITTILSKSDPSMSNISITSVCGFGSDRSKRRRVQGAYQ